MFTFDKFDEVTKDMTVKEVREVAGMLNGSQVNTAFQVGEKYLIRTVTLYYTGRLVEITPHELVLEDAAWIADTGRFAEAIKTGEFREVEPYAKRVLVNRGGVIDATIWHHELPRETK